METKTQINTIDYLAKRTIKFNPEQPYFTATQAYHHLNNPFMSGVKFDSVRFDKVRNDLDICKKAVRNDLKNLDYVGKKIEHNRELYITAVTNHRKSLGYFKEELLDKDLVLYAVKADGLAIQYAPEQYRNDKEVVTEAFKQNIQSFRFASNEIKSDKEFVMQASTKNGFYLGWASRELQNDKEVVLVAVGKNLENMREASPQIQELCKGKDPIKTLETTIAFEKLQNQLKPKEEFKQTQKLKI